MKGYFLDALLGDLERANSSATYINPEVSLTVDDHASSYDLRLILVHHDTNRPDGPFRGPMWFVFCYV